MNSRILASVEDVTPDGSFQLGFCLHALKLWRWTVLSSAATQEPHRQKRGDSRWNIAQSQRPLTRHQQHSIWSWPASVPGTHPSRFVALCFFLLAAVSAASPPTRMSSSPCLLPLLPSPGPSSSLPPF